MYRRNPGILRDAECCNIDIITDTEIEKKRHRQIYTCIHIQIDR